MLNLKVSKLGKRKLICINNFCGFINSDYSIKDEKDNIEYNINEILKKCNEEHTLEYMINRLSMKNKKYLKDYKFNLMCIDKEFECCLPDIEDFKMKVKFISLEEQKHLYQNSEDYNFYGVICDIYNKKLKETYEEKQFVLLIPKEKNTKEYIEEFLGDVIYENNFINNKETTFLLINNYIRQKYPFYPISYHISL